MSVISHVNPLGSSVVSELFQLLRDGLPCTRTELAAMTELARSTVAARIDTLFTAARHSAPHPVRGLKPVRRELPLVLPLEQFDLGGVSSLGAHAGAVGCDPHVRPRIVRLEHCLDRHHSERPGSS